MIDEKLVRHVAKLAHLHLTDAEVAHYQLQLDKIMGHVSQLAELRDVTLTPEQQRNIVPPSAKQRADEAVDAKVIDQALKQAPQHIGSAFQVPRIIE